MNPKTYLALGDSYTIGEGILLQQNFPYSLVQMLRHAGHNYTAPEIIAKTGWTTAELLESTEGYDFLENYDLVTLLVGVNNQYRGQDIKIYENDFFQLLEKAIALSKSKIVHVVSIPDWGATTFAEGRDREAIKKEIINYNVLCKEITLQHNCNFISITEEQAARANDKSYMAADGLHPSAREYDLWAKKILEKITEL